MSTSWFADRLADGRRLGRRAKGSWQRRRGSTPPAPDRTGFYGAADPGAGRRGEVLDHEVIDAPAGAQAWRVRYRTLDAAGRPVAASMAVAAPTGTATGPRPVLVWVHGAVGVTPGCAPSRSGLEAWYAEDLLALGVVVVVPDLTGLGIEGSTHPYLHGTTAGRSVLDAARAAADLPGTGAGTTIALAGHSAGGHAVLWANHLATVHDGAGLDLRVVVPMSPIADLTVAMAHYASTSDHAAFPVQLAATWPGIEPVATADVLTPEAIERLDTLATKRVAGLMRVFSGEASRWVQPGGFASPGWPEALTRQSPGRLPGQARVVVVQGDQDIAVLPAWSRQLVEDMRAAGQDAELRSYPDADHMAVADDAHDDVVGILRDALLGG